MSDIRINPTGNALTSLTTLKRQAKKTGQEQAINLSVGKDEVSLSGQKPFIRFGIKDISRMNLTSGFAALYRAYTDKVLQNDPDLSDYYNLLDEATNDDYALDQIVDGKYRVDGDQGIVIRKKQLDIPRFTLGNNEAEGGQGAGKGDGNEKSDGAGDDGDGAEGGSGKDNYKLAPWEHKLSPSEAAKIFGEKFNLRFLKPSSGESNRTRTIPGGKKYVPPGRRHKEEIYKMIGRAAGEAVAKGEEPNFDNMHVHRPDRRYTATDTVPLPDLKVAVIYLADVSSSVTDDMRNFTKTANRFVSYPIKYKYGKMAADLAGEEYNDADFFGKDGTEEGGLKERFVVYTTSAKETSEKDFYQIKADGGTACSNGFNLAKKIIATDYPPSEGWNVYIYHWTDGDIWSADKQKTLASMKELIDMGVRYIGNCDLGKPENQPSDFRQMLLDEFKDNPHVGSVGIDEKQKYALEDYRKVVRTFLPEKAEESEWYDNPEN